MATKTSQVTKPKETKPPFEKERGGKEREILKKNKKLKGSNSPSQTRPNGKRRVGKKIIIGQDNSKVRLNRQ